MRPIRVTHLVESFDLGGLERVVQSLVRHSGPAFRNEIVCATRGGMLIDEIEALGVRTRILGLSSYYPSGIARTALVLRAQNPDVVHSHGHFAGVLARVAAWCSGVPMVVHHLHTLDTTLRGRHRRLERALSRVTDRVVCCSQAVEEHARREIGLPGRLTITVPNGIEPAPVSKDRDARGMLGDPEPPVLGCVGSLTSHKGQATLVRALKLLPPDIGRGTLVLVGDGPERSALERLAGGVDNGWTVRFLGNRRDSRQLLPGFDLVAVPSIEREGFGLTAVEAMDAGRPVVASRVGGLPEVVKDGHTGLLVSQGDPASLAWGIATLLRRPDRGRAFGERGRDRVVRFFRAERMAREITSLYEEILDERRAA